MTTLALHIPSDPAATARPLFYDLKQAAKAVGLSWERFRKVRRAWTRDRDFPAEINEPGEAPRYLAAAVDAWVLRRTRRVHAQMEAAPPALRAGERPEAARAAAGRAALRQIMGGAA